MGFNKILYYGIKVFLVLILSYTYYKFKRAKTLDDTLTFRVKGRGMIAFYLSLLLSLAYIAYPANDETLGVALFLGSFVFLYVYLSMERLVFVGRKLIFAKFLAFEVRHVNKFAYQKGLFEFFIRGGRVKVRFPVGDMNYVLEMLSGVRQRNRKRVK